jgi:hypothetical protein
MRPLYDVLTGPFQGAFHFPSDLPDRRVLGPVRGDERVLTVRVSPPAAVGAGKVREFLCWLVFPRVEPGRHMTPAQGVAEMMDEGLPRVCSTLRIAQYRILPPFR